MSKLDWKLTNSQVGSLADTGVVNVDARGFLNLTVVSGAGCTTTVSRVDSLGATSHTTGTENSFTVAAGVRTVTEVDWPFYRISAAGGPSRYCLT